tara:strand:+ start:578 stop:952 length:375 start_codon:yes stop_codon:yes gene_type:complete
MKKTILLTATILGAISILIGAFGAHMIKDYLISIDKVGVFETAVKYQFYHVFFLLFLGLSYDKFDVRLIAYAFYLCLIGVLFFSGSLYLLCFTGNSVFGMITPFGGLSLVFAWLCLFWSIRKNI